MIKHFLLAGATVLALSAPVQAGDTERGILYGLAGALLLNELSQRNSEYYSHWYGAHTRHRYDRGFPPFRCRGNEIQCAYERGVWERELQAWQDAKNRAYWCGRDPRRCGYP